MCSKNGENVDMTTLGSTGKTDPSKFDGKKKLFLVPLIPMANLVLEKDKDLFDRHWNEISQQIDNLEVGLGSVRHVFHEMVHEEGDKGMELLKSVSPGSAMVVDKLVKSGANLEALEDPDILMEMTDWQRCLSIGLVSKKVFELASGNLQDLAEKRNLSITEAVSNKIDAVNTGILFISEGHTVQFPSDIQVFYVSPPSSNQLKAAVNELLSAEQNGE